MVFPLNKSTLEIMQWSSRSPRFSGASTQNKCGHILITEDWCSVVCHWLFIFEYKYLSQLILFWSIIAWKNWIVWCQVSAVMIKPCRLAGCYDESYAWSWFMIFRRTERFYTDLCSILIFFSCLIVQPVLGKLPTRHCAVMLLPWQSGRCGRFVQTAQLSHVG